MKVHEFVREANWCQRALCKDGDGNTWAWPYASNITQRCITGMILYCYRSTDMQQDILSKVKALVGDNIAHWNDRPERTWQQVQALAKELDI